MQSAAAVNSYLSVIEEFCSVIHNGIFHFRRRENQFQLVHLINPHFHSSHSLAHAAAFVERDRIAVEAEYSEINIITV
ncbi:hypothetical protein SDC9_175289 [bioreactor metagenome]|uniref:Uncharacterized protein n=1 Tax=bioreactor metagenome TaxID=1076179 RepID=A0A645GMA3_9ZZZZ